MNLFNSLFSKKDQSYRPVNRLETLFIEAGNSSSKRPEFYRTLFHFELFCLGHAKDNEDGSESARFQVYEVDGTQVIYVFTSEAALSWYVSQRKQPPANYVGLRASTLFEMIQGKFGFVLNPDHDCTRYFTPSEVTEMMKDFNSNDHLETIPAGQKLSIGQPAELPLNLLNGLNGYLKNSRQIQEVYFGLLANEQGHLQYLGAIDFDDTTPQEEEERALQDLFIISKETLEPGKSMSFCKLRESNFRNAIQSGALKAVSSYSPS